MKVQESDSRHKLKRLCWTKPATYCVIWATAWAIDLIREVNLFSIPLCGKPSQEKHFYNNFGKARNGKWICRCTLGAVTYPWDNWFAHNCKRRIHKYCPSSVRKETWKKSAFWTVIERGELSNAKCAIEMHSLNWTYGTHRRQSWVKVHSCICFLTFRPC